MSSKTINFPVYTIKQFKEIAYQTSYVLMKGWKRISHLTYDDLCNERPDIYKNSNSINWNSNIINWDELDHNLWIKETYKVEFHLPEDRWNMLPPKNSIYHTLEEAYEACIKEEQ